MNDTLNQPERSRISGGYKGRCPLEVRSAIHPHDRHPLAGATNTNEVALLDEFGAESTAHLQMFAHSLTQQVLYIFHTSHMRTCERPLCSSFINSSLNLVLT